MIIIKNPFIITENGIEKKDILISNEKITKISDKISIKNAKKINGEGFFLIPALIDIHVHTRVPGKEKAEDFHSLTKAALSGGVGTIVAMPNTKPVQDNSQILKKLKIEARKISPLNILFASSITKNLEGKEIVNVKENSKYVCSFTDDGFWVEDINIMAEILLKAKKYGKIVFSHPQFKKEQGVINEGRISRKYNLPGIPEELEYIAVFRDCLLSVILDTPLHLQHISTKKSIYIIREAKRLNRHITAETAPHYFCFTEDNLENLNPNFKMNPPLRTEQDRKEIIKAIRDGTIDIIATDHAPHSEEEKDLGIEKAPCGVIGLETLLSASLTELYFKNKIPLEIIIPKMTLNPSKLIKVEKRGLLKEGFYADLTIFDLDKEWKVENFYSKSSNSPFKGKTLKGKNIITIIKGKVLYRDGEFFL